MHTATARGLTRALSVCGAQYRTLPWILHAYTLTCFEYLLFSECWTFVDICRRKAFVQELSVKQVWLSPCLLQNLSSNIISLWEGGPNMLCTPHAR